MATQNSVEAPSGLNGRHTHTYEAIFRHPLAHNLEWHDVRSLLATIGDVTEEQNGTLNVTTIRSVRIPVAALSGGQRQSVAISRAVMWNSKVVVLDEPTAALGVAQTAQVLALIKRLREQGLGVVVISHNLHEVFEVADRIIVLRLGRRVASFRRHETTPEEVVAAITGATKGHAT